MELDEKYPDPGPRPGPDPGPCTGPGACAGGPRSPIVIKYPNEKLLEVMIEEEETIRTSQEYKDRCTAVKDVVNGWLDVTAEIQREIVRKHGFTDKISCDVAVNHLRRASQLYPDNLKFKTVPLYVRNNKAHQGSLKEGDPVPDVGLHSLDGKEHRLHDLLPGDGLPTLLFASSAT